MDLLKLLCCLLSFTSLSCTSIFSFRAPHVIIVMAGCDVQFALIACLHARSAPVDVPFGIHTPLSLYLLAVLCLHFVSA
jgi:hypothetical protein